MFRLMYDLLRLSRALLFHQFIIVFRMKNNKAASRFAVASIYYHVVLGVMLMFMHIFLRLFHGLLSPQFNINVACFPLIHHRVLHEMV